MFLREIFVRHLPAVEDLHDRCRKLVFDLESAYGRPLSLLDVMLASQSLKAFSSKNEYFRYKNSIVSALNQDSDMPTVANFGVFSHIEITTIKACYSFLLNTEADYWNLITEHQPIKWQTLVDISATMTTPSVLLSLKYYWLYLNYDKQYPFDGVLANTGPVRNALKTLFGSDFGSPLRSTMQQQRLAGEINHPDLDAFRMNSVLWLMGGGS